MSRRRTRVARPAQAPTRSLPTVLPLGALAAGMGLSLLAAPVMAQTAPAGEATTASQTLPAVGVKAAKQQAAPSKENLQTVTTNIGKGKQAIRDIPQSITVMTEKLLDDVKLDTLKQALHYTAGITFAATENGTDQDIRMRGFPVATVGDLLIDGMKDPSQYDRDTFNYDRIEVMRGSASMIFGRGSTGGVVNQVTKKPMLADQTDLVTTLGTGDYLRTTVDLNKRTDENAALRINAMVTHADNYGATVKKYGVAPTYSWGIGTADEFTVGLFYLNVDNKPLNGFRYVGGQVPKNLNPNSYYGTAGDFLKGEATYVSASHVHRFGGNAELRTQFRSGEFARSQWSTTASFAAGTTQANLNANTGITRGGLNPRKDTYNGTYLQSDFSNKLTLLGMKHEVLTGVDLSAEQATRYSNNGARNTLGTRPGATVGNPNNEADLTGTGNGPLWRETSSYAGWALGAYAQDLIQIADHWKVLGGVRWDRFETTTQSLTFGTNASPSLTPTATALTHLKYSALWSHRVGLLYQPTQEASFHFSHSSSFNTAADTYQFTSALNANTPAEKSRNIEIGAKLDWLNGDLSTRFALFRTEKFNERTTDIDFATSAYTLSGKRHSRGLEVDVVGRVTQDVEVYFSYAYIPEAKIDRTGSAGTGLGQRVGLTPRHTGATWLSWQAMPKFRVAAGLRGASENRPLQGTSGAASTTAKAGGYTVVDAMAEYKFTPDTYAQLNVTNLANRTYGDQLYPGFSILGEGRSIKLTVGTRF